MNDWIKVVREDASKRENESLIVIRSEQFIFNGKFVRDAQLERKKGVLVLLNERQRKIAFKFLDTITDNDAYRLHADGGGEASRKSKARAIKATNIISKTPWIKSVSIHANKSLKQFTPEWNNIERQYEISLAPSFEIRVYDKSQLPSDAIGVYRYLRQNRVVYIGKGNIRDRANSLERSSWDYDTIEYSMVHDDIDILKWEKFWLDRHNEEFGRLPEYNKISGIDKPI
jgi:hypothetical protein